MILVKFFLILLISTLVSCECPSTNTIEYQSKCYFFNTNEMAFPWAEISCIQMGGHLASIHDAFVNDVLLKGASDFFYRGSSADFWNGATNLLSLNGSWSWTDKTSFNFNQWSRGEPQNAIGSNCAAISKMDGYWSSQNCLKPKPFVCQISSSDSPISSTSNTHSTTTIPSTPCATKKCDNGWDYFEKTNSCYRRFDDSRRTWEDSERLCQQFGGHLASMHSIEENSFILKKYGCPWEIYMGLKMSDSGTTWEWSDGSPTDYLPWDQGEPSGGKCTLMAVNHCNDNSAFLHTYSCTDKSWFAMCKISLN